MRKFLAFGAVLALSALILGGCAITDYCNNDQCAQRLAEIGVDGQALGCASAQISAQGNPQSPVNDPLTGLGTSQDIWDPEAQAMVRCTNNPNNQCLTNATFGPPVCFGGVANGVSAEEAADWEDDLGTYIFFGESQVFSPASLQGTYVLAGGKSLGSNCDPATGQQSSAVAVASDCPSNKTAICHVPPGNPSNEHTICVGAPAECAHLQNHEGDRVGTCGGGPVVLQGWPTIRLNGFFRENTGAFTCIGDRVDGLFGSPESQILGDSLSNGRLPGLELDSVALDNSAAITFGPNVRAVSARRQAGGFSTFWGIIGRTAEGRHEFVLPASGLAEFLSGEPMTIHSPNPSLPLTATVTGALGDDGMFNMQVSQLTWDEAVFTPSSPIILSMDRNLKRFKVGDPGVDQTAVLRELAKWAVENMPLGEAWTLKGTIPELGVQIPNIWMQLDPVTIGRFAKGEKERQIGTPGLSGSLMR